MQADNGSLVYYMPGYNPYASGAVVGMDGQSVGQQSYYPSGYPVSYGSEAIPCYSWESTYAGDVSNGNASMVNGHGSVSSNSVRSKGSNSGKSSGNFGSKFSKSTYTQPYKPLNKVTFCLMFVGNDVSLFCMMQVLLLSIWWFFYSLIRHKMPYLWSTYESI